MDEFFSLKMLLMVIRRVKIGVFCEILVIRVGFWVWVMKKVLIML